MDSDEKGNDIVCNLVKKYENEISSKNLNFKKYLNNKESQNEEYYQQVFENILNDFEKCKNEMNQNIENYHTPLNMDLGPLFHNNNLLNNHI